MVAEPKSSQDPARRREWERVTAASPKPVEGARETFRINAPSPSQEVLARHDADLAKPDDPDQIICF